MILNWILELKTIIRVNTYSSTKKGVQVLFKQLFAVSGKSFTELIFSFEF